MIGRGPEPRSDGGLNAEFRVGPFRARGRPRVTASGACPGTEFFTDFISLFQESISIG
jgi:hypothetical protein